MLIVKRILNY